MFTGLISAVGEITAVDRSAAGLELTIQAPYVDLSVGESVAVAGACLTVVRLLPAAGAGPDGSFTVHVVDTSVERTLFDRMAAGRKVNLERALAVGDRLGGHLVSGHVDGVGRVARVGQRQDARLLDIEVPPEVAAVTIPLGSIAVDGVSLTVNAIPGPGLVQVSLIPITLRDTTLGSVVPGDPVHLEGDVIGKYVRALHQPWAPDDHDIKASTEARRQS